MWRDVAVATTLTNLTNHLVKGLGRRRAYETVVHLHTRCDVAVGEALGLLESEHPVRRRPTDGASQRALRVIEQLLATGQEARDIGADRDHVFAHGLKEKHVVERGRALHVSGRGASEFGYFRHARVAEVAVLFLREVQQGQHRGATVRIEGDEFFGALA